LLLVFNVTFPETLSLDVARRLSAAFDRQKNLTSSSNGSSSNGGGSSSDEDAEQIKMEEFDGEGQWKGGVDEQPHVEEEEEEEQEGIHHGGIPGGPQCAQQ